ncbi:hypothetical protein GCM10009585_02570 [Brevibacterium paucivorans]|uniref:hypothetical protein n=1 Tax=Brevibacterium paucivorans TaxID=170994 RepID=UPI0031E41EF4
MNLFMTNVPGYVFLAFYAVLIAICVVLLIVARMTSAGPLRKTPNVLELAYASGGRIGLVTTVVSLLDPPQRLEYLERHGNPELYRSISSHPIVGRVRQLMEASDLQHLSISTRAENDQQFKELEKDLIADMKRNRLLSDNKTFLRKLAGWFTLAVFLFGLFRCAIGMLNDKPIGFLVAMTFGLIFLIGFYVYAGPTQAMKRTRAVTLKDTMAQMRGLEPQSQAFALGFPLALAVGGASAAWQLDPSFASLWALPTAAALADGAGSSSCGSGSSCSSCSSCGGGGGCGGCGGGD